MGGDPRARPEAASQASSDSMDSSNQASSDPQPIFLPSGPLTYSGVLGRGWGGVTHGVGWGDPWGGVGGPTAIWPLDLLGSTRATGGMRAQADVLKMRGHRQTDKRDGREGKGGREGEDGGKERE